MTATHVSDLTIDELQDLIRTVVRQTLLELLNDPDAGLDLREDFIERLQQSIASQETRSAQDVAARLGLEW